MMYIERGSRESNALDMMRFPLAVLIVLLHTGVTCGPENFAYYLPNYFFCFIVTVAVPAFFFMSGYLFFMGKERFGMIEWKGTLKKKMKSLLVPYIIWNLIAFVLSAGMNYINNHTIGDVKPWELHKIFWADGDGIMSTSMLGYKFTAIASPAAGVLWFLRDLMMMMICSFFMFQIMKWLKWWFFPIVIIMNIIGLGVPFPGFSLAAITFFYSGAFFCIHEINFFEWIKKHNVLVYALWPLLILLQMSSRICGFDILPGLGLASNMAGIAFVFNWAYDVSIKKDKWHTNISRLGETSFFIYTFANTLIVWLLNKEIGYALDIIPTIGPALNYSFMFIARVAECVIAFYIMKKFCPSILGILIGGRIRQK